MVEIADVFTTRGDRLVRADGFPPHPERFSRLGIDIVAVLGADQPAPGSTADDRGSG